MFSIKHIIWGQSAMNSLSFSSYIDSFDEGFFDSMKQGFQNQHAKSSAVQPGSSESDYEKYSSKVLPAIQKAGSSAKKYSEKLGIPLPIATAIVTSGLIGGPGAIPFGVLLYFAKKQVMGVASKAFDKGVELAQPQAQAQPQASRLVLPGSADWNGGRIPVQRSWTSYEDYASMRDLQEGWFSDKASEAGKYWNDKGADQVGGALGKAAGYVTGNVKKYGSRIGSIVKSSFSDLTQFASQNKLAIGKAAFLFGVGIAMGTGVGMAYNALAGGADELASQSIGGLKDSGVVSDQEINRLRRLVLDTHHKIEDVPVASVGLQEPGVDPTGDAAQFANQAADQGIDYSHMQINKPIESPDGTVSVKVRVPTSLGHAKGIEIASDRAHNYLGGGKGVATVGREFYTDTKGVKYLIQKFKIPSADDLNAVDQVSKKIGN